MVKLKLYVTGNTPTSEQVVAKIREIMVVDAQQDFELEVVDIFDDPEQAINDAVLATPTLLKVLPLPVRRLVGDLKDRERVLAGLELLGDIEV